MSILIKSSILIKISKLIEISILINPSNNACLLHLPHHHPFVDLVILGLQYQKEIWQIDEKINLVQKGKVRYNKHFNCVLVGKSKTWWRS